MLMCITAAAQIPAPRVFNLNDFSEVHSGGTTFSNTVGVLAPDSVLIDGGWVSDFDLWWWLQENSPVNVSGIYSHAMSLPKAANSLYLMGVDDAHALPVGKTVCMAWSEPDYSCCGTLDWNNMGDTIMFNVPISDCDMQPSWYFMDSAGHRWFVYNEIAAEVEGEGWTVYLNNDEFFEDWGTYGNYDTTGYYYKTPRKSPFKLVQIGSTYDHYYRVLWRFEDGTRCITDSGFETVVDTVPLPRKRKVIPVRDARLLEGKKRVYTLQGQLISQGEFVPDIYCYHIMIHDGVRYLLTP